MNHTWLCPDSDVTAFQYTFFFSGGLLWPSHSKGWISLKLTSNYFFSFTFSQLFCSLLSNTPLWVGSSMAGNFRTFYRKISNTFWGLVTNKKFHTYKYWNKVLYCGDWFCSLHIWFNSTTIYLESQVKYVNAIWHGNSWIQTIENYNPHIFYTYYINIMCMYTSVAHNAQMIWTKGVGL